MALISSIAVGTTLTFKEKSYVVVSHEPTGTKIVSKVRADRRRFETGTSISSPNLYLPEQTTNVAYYFNNTYYDNLDTDFKSLLVQYEWNTSGVSDATQVGTGRKTIPAYVGFLTSSEALAIRRYLTLDSVNGDEWTLTPSSTSSSIIFLMKTSGSTPYVYLSENNAARSSEYIARPVFVVKNTTNVIGTEIVLNQGPTITPTSRPSGTYTTKPSFNYTASDPEGSAMTVTEKIDGILSNTRTNVQSGSPLTYTPSDLAWLRTRINQTVNIEITADDGNGGVTTVTYPITRTTPAIDMQLKTPFETDVAARRLLLQLEGNIPNDAVVSVLASNNAFDASPTWETATNLVLSGLPYPFNNTTKTASKWGVSFKINIQRGSSTQQIYIDGLGGAFD